MKKERDLQSVGQKHTTLSQPFVSQNSPNFGKNDDTLHDELFPVCLFVKKLRFVSNIVEAM